MDLTHKIVRRLLRDNEVGFSRNKNFDAHDDPLVRRATRIFRHLRSIETDLLAADAMHLRLEQLNHDDGRVQLKLSSSGGERWSYLTEAEWDLLLESPRVTDILRRLLDEAAHETQNRLANSHG